MKFASTTLCLLGLFVVGSLNNMNSSAVAVSPPTAAATVVASSNEDTGFQPIPISQCKGLQTRLEQTLKVKVTQTISPFPDYVHHRGGKGCLLTATGTGQQFSSPATVVQKVDAMFTQLGWGKDPAYAAGGATGMAAGFIRSNTFGLLRAEWRPAPAVKCPSNQPIASCVLAPEQKLYTITLNLAYLQAGVR